MNNITMDVEILNGVKARSAKTWILLLSMSHLPMVVTSTIILKKLLANFTLIKRKSIWL